MPKIALEIKANLENVTNLKPEGDDFRWYLKLKCSNCGEQPDHWQYVTLEELHEIPGSRGSAHLVQKCKLCGRQNTMEIIKDSYSSYNLTHNREFQKLVVFDCRGIEPTDFDPRVGWMADCAESNSKFRDIDLGEKEWCEYDEKAGLPVEINEWEHRLVIKR